MLLAWTRTARILVRWRDSTMKKFPMASALLILALTALACSSGTSSDGNGGAGGGTREFVSGDLANGASFSHTFTSAGSVPYFCRYHGNAGGIGMSGVITVNAAAPGYTPVIHQLSIVTSALPSPTITAGDQVTWTNNHGLTHTVESDN